MQGREVKFTEKSARLNAENLQENFPAKQEFNLWGSVGKELSYAFGAVLKWCLQNFLIFWHSSPFTTHPPSGNLPSFLLLLVYPPPPPVQTSFKYRPFWSDWKSLQPQLSKLFESRANHHLGSRTHDFGSLAQGQIFCLCGVNEWKGSPKVLQLRILRRTEDTNASGMGREGISYNGHLKLQVPRAVC